MTTTLARREAYIPVESRKKLRLIAAEDETTISDQIATLLEKYEKGEIEIDENEPELESDDPPVRVRFAIDADVWRRIRSRAFEEDTSVSSILRRAIAAL